MALKELYTLKETAQALKVSERTIHRYIRDGKLEAHKIGQAWRIPEESLKSLYENGQTPGEKEKRAAEN